MRQWRSSGLLLRLAAVAAPSSRESGKNASILLLRSLSTTAGDEMHAIDDMDAHVSADHAKSAQDFRSSRLQHSLELQYSRENGSELFTGVSYKQNRRDVELLVKNILNSKDVACVKQILQKWLKKLSLKSSLGRDFTAVSYDEAVSVASDLVREFGKRGCVQITTQVLEWMQYQNWFSLDPKLKIHIIDVLGKSSSFDIAVKVFDQFIKIIVKKDLGMYIALLNAFCKAGRYEAVEELFREMKQSLKPSKLSYNILMHSYVKAGQSLTKVVSVFKEMYLQGIKADVVTYDILISACVNGKLAREARVFFENMKKQGLEPNIVTYTALISVYVASGNCAAAMEVLHDMVKANCKPNVITFSCIIHGLGQEGRLDEAEKMFKTMKDLGVKPTSITFNILMTMYSRIGNLARAQSCFHDMVEFGLEPTYVSFLTLMYCFKSVGAYKEVVSIYEDVKGKDSLCNMYIYTESLDACVKWGNWPKIASILADIEASGYDPSVVTCTVVLMALSSKNCKTVEEASVLIQFFKQHDSKLVIILRYLIFEALDDDQVEALLLELGKIILFDVIKTWTIFSSGLVDALWTLGWHRRAAVVLKWTMEKGYHDCLCFLNKQEWKLDLRNLSVGSAMVAFYQWLKWLEEAAIATESVEKVEGSEAEFNQLTSAVLELQLQKLVPAGSGQRLFPSYLRFPPLLTVVSGWGKQSKVQGASVVRDAVEREIFKLDLPFRSEPALPGRWTTDGYSLKLWLQNPDACQKLLISDVIRD